MNTNSNNSIENVTMSEILEVASWDRPRTNAELISFIESREAALAQK